MEEGVTYYASGSQDKKTQELMRPMNRFHNQIKNILISGATVNGENLLSNNTFDKGISVGENSDVKITNLKTLNTKLTFTLLHEQKIKFLKFLRSQEIITMQ